MSEVSKNAGHYWQKMNKNGEEMTIWNWITAPDSIDYFHERYSVVMERKFISTLSLKNGLLAT